MTTRKSEVLLHPVRLRIVLAVADDEVTTAEIATRLPDVPQATLYRHIARLSEAGILDVVDERQARGAVEKTYRVNATEVSIDADEAADMSVEDYFRAFTAFTGILLESFGRYLNSPGADPIEDGVSFRQARMWLTDDELAALATDVASALGPYLATERTPERSPRLLSTILMPDPTPRGD